MGPSVSKPIPSKVLKILPNDEKIMAIFRCSFYTCQPLYAAFDHVSNIKAQILPKLVPYSNK